VPRLRDGVVLAVGSDIVGVQATSVAKITESSALPILRKAGVRMLVHGWRKVNGSWVLRELDVS
jgi:hypothetical protein